MRGVCLALVLAAVVSIATGSAAAANYAQESLDRYFRFEYEVTPSATRPVVSGYVYNMHPGKLVERMQVAVQSVDASGNVVGTTSTWVLGGVPSGNRAYFSTPATPGASYRVQVVFFDWGKRA